MKITKREKYLLSESLDFLVHRYILSKMRMCGMEKAEMHIKIAETIFEFVHCRKRSPEEWDNIMVIHDDLTIITDHLDKYGYIVGEEMDTYLVVKNVIKAIVKFVENIKNKTK
jgi:uncharacterized protein YutD